MTAPSVLRLSKEEQRGFPQSARHEQKEIRLPQSTET